MIDLEHVLADMAGQIRRCRAQDGLTLQQLATRSGVAASTIHKVESQQMVPTVSVLLKIARGLGRRPAELIRDEAAPVGTGPGATDRAEDRPGVWRIWLGPDETLPALDLTPLQRAILLVEQGALHVAAGGREIELGAGDCIEVEGKSIRSPRRQADPVQLTLIVSPPGTCAARLGEPGLMAGPAGSIGTPRPR
ncbi:MAG: helix-turn-helix transcriptional regulator [Myxococcota bacterium]